MVPVGFFMLGALCTLALVSWAWGRVMADPLWARAFVGGMVRGLERKHGVITVQCWASIEVDDPSPSASVVSEQWVTLDLEDVAVALATPPLEPERQAS